MGKDRIGGKPSTMYFSGLMLFSARARAWRESNILCVLQDKVGYNKEVNSYVCVSVCIRCCCGLRAHAVNGV